MLMLISRWWRRASAPRSSHIHDDQRQPTLTITSARSKACFTDSPAMMPPWPMKCGLSEGTTPSAIWVGTTGAFRRCASARSAGAAPATTTPPPPTISGRFAPRSSATAASTRAAAGRGPSVAR